MKESGQITLETKHIKIDHQDTTTEETTTKKSPLWRIGLLVLVIVSLILLGKFTPLGNYMSIPVLRDLIHGAGFWGILIFMGCFVIGSLMNLPGSAFLVFSILVFGYWEGAGITYISAVIATMITFLFARLVSGRALSGIKNKRIRRWVANVESKPIKTLIVLRAFLQLSPFVGYMLALTGIKSKQYLVGNLIGMLVPIGYTTLALFLLENQVTEWLGVTI